MTLVIGPTDKELADGFRARMMLHAEQACRIKEEARRCGLEVNFGVSVDGFGRFIPNVSVSKPL